MEIAKNVLFDLNYSAGRHIAGVDEAGRGPLAGPLVVAAVIMPLTAESIIIGVDDSKKLSEKARERLFSVISERAVEIVTAVIDNAEIDDVNILNAVKRGMTDCITGLKSASAVLIDFVEPRNIPVPVYPITHGDALSYSIACASIIAKVTRDDIMRGYDSQYPQYGFAKHKGYGTAAHYAAIERFGVCPLHRLTFLKKLFTVKTD